MKPSIWNKAPVRIPWLTIWRTDPSTPCRLKANSPMVMKPMWLTDEYATNRFMSEDQGHRRPIDDSDHRQDHHPGYGLHRHLREEAHTETDHAIDAHLQEHAGQNHRPRCGSINMRVRQPGVYWKHGDLDGESHEEAHEGPELQTGRKASRL